MDSFCSFCNNVIFLLSTCYQFVFCCNFTKKSNNCSTTLAPPLHNIRPAFRECSGDDVIPDDLLTLKLHDLCVLTTLGVGGFGRVELVSRPYAVLGWFISIYYITATTSTEKALVYAIYVHIISWLYSSKSVSNFPFLFNILFQIESVN